MKTEIKIYEVTIFIANEFQEIAVGKPMSEQDWKIYLDQGYDDLDAWTPANAVTRRIDVDIEDASQCCGSYDFHDADCQCQLINELDEKFNSFANAYYEQLYC